MGHTVISSVSDAPRNVDIVDSLVFIPACLMSTPLPYRQISTRDQDRNPLYNFSLGHHETLRNLGLSWGFHFRYLFVCGAAAYASHNKDFPAHSLLLVVYTSTACLCLESTSLPPYRRRIPIPVISACRLCSSKFEKPVKEMCRDIWHKQGPFAGDQSLATVFAIHRCHTITCSTRTLLPHWLLPVLEVSMLSSVSTVLRFKLAVLILLSTRVLWRHIVIQSLVDPVSVVCDASSCKYIISTHRHWCERNFRYSVHLRMYFL
jgi:hypothetical protein